MKSSQPRLDSGELRRALESGLPRDVAESPEPKNLYLPPRHANALSPEKSLVVGIRGAGKSVWWRALQSPEHRHAAANALGSSAVLVSSTLDESTEVAAGFGEKASIEEYPDKRVLRQLLSAGYPPAEIWRTVVAWQTWARQGDSEFKRQDSWIDRVGWMVKNPERAALAFEHYDQDLANQGRQVLILFDALDRTADEWEELDRLLRGLLEVVLELRGYDCIQAKVFVRPDMLADSVIAFRDASKVLAGKAELRWSRADLYGLLFQRLGNASEGGEAFRSGCEAIGSGRWTEGDSVWQMPRGLREDEDLQRTIFHEITGPWMGTNPKRGFPYTWLPNHLGDAAEQVSPRSFLWALRTAVGEPIPKDWPHALHYDGIKRGVQEASKIRVAEIGEDFPWVKTLMEPLRALAVPCDFSEVSERWEANNVLSSLDAKASEGLLPKRLSEGLDGLREDLLALAVFRRQQDGRLNMPDVYRVGFGLGRRGGVKPIR